MKTNIPIYRAKKIDSDEYHVGLYYESATGLHCIQNGTAEEIDISTLAIHFDKKDKDDKNVFFSLSANGRGGDIVEYSSNKDKYIAMWNSINDKLLFMPIEDDFEMMNTMANVKVTGIQE